MKLNETDLKKLLIEYSQKSERDTSWKSTNKRVFIFENEKTEYQQYPDKALFLQLPLAKVQICMTNYYRTKPITKIIIVANSELSMFPTELVRQFSKNKQR